MRQAYIILDFCYPCGDSEEHVHPVVLFGRQDVVLVDCGYPGSLGILEAQLASHSMKPEQLTKLVLTHQDDDHIGGAAELKERCPALQILAPWAEEPYMTGVRKNLRLQQAEELQDRLPEAQKEFGRQFCDRLKGVRPVPVDGVLYPGDTFDWGGGCEVIATPGHTPGHISIRALNHDFIITGDAAVVEGRALSVANPEYCLDLKRAQESLAALLQAPCRCYICYHGGLYRRQS